MLEFNAGQMTENDLLDAAKSIFTAQEKDFEKLKSEKWYQTLFHAITLNQDGKKYTVRGIHSLAKLQQLFMTVYVNNYRKSHEQLDAVISAVIRNSEAIKRLYGRCILNLEEQQGLSSLDSYDAEILALFLGEYRNNAGEVPEEVKRYNRGVLTALNQHVPEGTMDSHQIRKLKNPRVVYRCFMEQCAVDGTIDTQEWPDKIYEHLRDFELSDNSKAEIKEAVKREAEFAGAEYFIVKYSKSNVGVLDIDFEFEISSTEEAERKKLDKQFDLMRLSFAAMGFSTSFSLAGLKHIGYSSVNIDWLNDHDLDQEIASGKIKAKVITDSIKESLETECGFVYAYRFSYDDEQRNHYFFIVTADGFFFFIRGRIAYVVHGAIQSLREDASSLMISAWPNGVKWYSENGTEETDRGSSMTEKIIISRDKENSPYIRGLRKGLERMIETCGGYVPSPEEEVVKIIEKYIGRISKSSSSVAYMVKDFRFGDEKNEKRLKKALSKYALKVRREEAIGFIDTSLFGNGGDGLLFAKDGIAFDYAFEKVFIKYEEIDRIEIDKGMLWNDLVLHGDFSEREDNSSTPSISDTYFDLYALKECLEQIRYVI